MRNLIPNSKVLSFPTDQVASKNPVLLQLGLLAATTLAANNRSVQRLGCGGRITALSAIADNHANAARNVPLLGHSAPRWPNWASGKADGGRPRGPRRRQWPPPSPVAPAEASAQFAKQGVSRWRRRSPQGRAVVSNARSRRKHSGGGAFPFSRSRDVPALKSGRRVSNKIFPLSRREAEGKTESAVFAGQSRANMGAPGRSGFPNGHKGAVWNGLPFPSVQAKREGRSCEATPTVSSRTPRDRNQDPDPILLGPAALPS